MDLPRSFTSTSAVPVSDFPPHTRRQLLALTVRHRRRNDIYSRVLREVLDAFNAAGIDAVVLKGAALAHVLYPAVGLRPMSDIDLLVDPQLTRRAQALLAELGFFAPARPTVRRLGRASSLASRDQRRRRACRPGRGPPRRPESRLLRVADHETCHRVEGVYASRPARIHARPRGHALPSLPSPRRAKRTAPIDLGRRRRGIRGTVQRRDRLGADLPGGYPFVLNTLSLLHLVNPLPHELARRPIPPPPVTQGVGVGFKPLATTLRSDRLDEVWRDLLCPSDWWLRLYYGVNPTTSLFWYRWVRHPVHLGRWLARRAGIYGLWRAGSVN